MKIYPNDGVVISNAQNDIEGVEVINLPQTDAYADEVDYFVSCVKTKTEPIRIKSQELESVIDLLKK